VANGASGTDENGAPKTKIFGFQVGQDQYYDLNNDYTNLIPDISSETGMNDLFSSLSNAVSSTSNLQVGNSLINNHVTSTVTFGSLSSGETVELGGLTFTASANVSASQLASAFSNASVGRVNGEIVSETFTGLGVLSGTLSGWKISDFSNSNAQATFTSISAGEVSYLVNTPIDIQESAVVTFGMLFQNETVELGGLTFTATEAGGATASQVAAAFADYSNGRSNGSTINQTYDGVGTLTGTLSGWKIDSYDAANSQATFTASSSRDVANLQDQGAS
jgi:hypothetical protein